MENSTLKSGATFIKPNGNVIKVKKRHGKNFMVTEISVGLGIEVEKVMGKAEIVALKEFDGKTSKTKNKKVSKREMEVLKSISDGNTVLDLVEKMPDFSRSQIAGHISILNRKGLVEIDSETRSLTKTKISEKIIA